MRFIFFIALLTINLTTYGQTIEGFDAEKFLRGEKTVPKVLLVGSFHFDYPNLDAHTTSTDLQLDFNDTEKRSEVEELLEYISEFKPTQIVVERWKTSNINEQYQKYLEGQYQLGESEIYQIAFPIGKKFNISGLSPADAGTWVLELANGPDSTCIRPILQKTYEGWDWESDDYWDERYDHLYAYEDTLELNSNLLDIFKFKNSKKRMEIGYGAYLIGDFGLDNFRGANALSMHWYNRNLRIFQNIRNYRFGPDERIMVLFGAGHMGILHNLFASSPEFELVYFNELGEK